MGLLKNETKKEEHLGSLLTKPQPLPALSPFSVPPLFFFLSPSLPFFSPSIFPLLTSLPLLYLSIPLSFELVLGSSQ